MMKSFILLVTLMLAGCAVRADTSTAYEDGVARRPADDSAAIDSVYARFSNAYDALDPDAVVALYTDDAYYLPGGGAILQGTADLRNAFAFLTRTKEAGGDLGLSFRIVDRGIDGDLAYDIGYYRLASKRTDGTEGVSVGKFITILKRQSDGRWLFQADGFSNAPPEAFDAPIGQ